MIKVWQVLEESLNHLSGPEGEANQAAFSQYSCDAALYACYKLHGVDPSEGWKAAAPSQEYKVAVKFFNEEVEPFLKELGVDPHGFGEFNSLDLKVLPGKFNYEAYKAADQAKQRARALWLTWAGMIAKEEGK